MRNNQPVTQREYVLEEETVLISRTDLKGNITYANAALWRSAAIRETSYLAHPII